MVRLGLRTFTKKETAQPSRYPPNFYKGMYRYNRPT
jgi:hypothetical protein